MAAILSFTLVLPQIDVLVTKAFCLFSQFAKLVVRLQPWPGHQLEDPRSDVYAVSHVLFLAHMPISHSLSNSGRPLCGVWTISSWFGYRSSPLVSETAMFQGETRAEKELHGSKHPNNLTS